MSFELIETVTVGAGGAASIEFTSIPQDGTDLVVKLSGRSTNTNFRSLIQLNSTYGDDLLLYGNGSTVSTTSSNFSRWLNVSASTDTSNTFGNAEAYISNYTSSSDKSISVDSVRENNNTASEQTISAISVTTGAVTSLTIVGGSFDFVAGTTASLYKITAA